MTLPASIQFFIAMVAYAINERMSRKMEYRQEEIRILKEILTDKTGTTRITFTADQRRRLAVKGKELLPKERAACCTLVKPETILKWFRQLAARKYDGSKNRSCGRPRKADEIRELVLRIANENLGWGYTKIRDALRGVGVSIGRTTVANFLAEIGMVPAPERTRTRTWKQFLKIHLETLYACDFFSVEALGITGTVRHMVFFVIEIKTRAVEIAGICVYPNEAWMKQVARNLTDPIDGFLRKATYLIHDRDPLFTEAWTKILRTSGVNCVRIPANSPNCNAHAERFVKTIRNECLDHMVLFGERHMRYVVREYVAHYMIERYHQGIDSTIIRPGVRAANDNGTLTEIRCRSRLGGLLNYYHREAA